MGICLGGDLKHGFARVRCPVAVEETIRVGVESERAAFWRLVLRVQPSIGQRRRNLSIALTCLALFDYHMSEGRRRLDNPEDFVRIEISTALKRGVGVIPVVVDGASMPRSTDLPDDLKLLVRRNALEVSHTRFKSDCARLIAALDRILGARAERREKERAEAEQREMERLEVERRNTEPLEIGQRDRNVQSPEERRRLVTGGSTPPAAVDVTAILDDLASKNPEKLNWRRSIVDMMELVGMDSSLASRKELAKDFNYTGDTRDTATMDVWLHKMVFKRIAENGGKVPKELLT